MTRGIRNKNPGNIDFNKRQFDRDRWVGEIGIESHSRPRFTTFSHEVFGIRALCVLLLTYHHHRLANDGSPIDTVQEIIDRWAPPSENNTDAYAAHVRDLLDIEKGCKINVDDPTILATLAESIIQHENGDQPYNVHVVLAGVELALGR